MAVPYEALQEQMRLILHAWGMSAANAATTALVMADTDLHGIDSHGVSMIPPYEQRRREGRITLTAEPEVVHETPVALLVDGGGNLGHVPSTFAVKRAIEKARAAGMCLAGVRNSAHFGAAGFYTRLAAEAGMIGMAGTSGGLRMAAAFGSSVPMLSTDPWSFAAPAQEGAPPFLLDMATTAAAYGRVRNAATEGRPIPADWGLDKAGHPTTNPHDIVGGGGFLAPLGGQAAGHKGYGLAVMVNILATCMTGASLVTRDGHTLDRPGSPDIGHFFFVIDPGLLRPAAETRADTGRLLDALRAAPAVDPARPVMVAGDPERAKAEIRRREGIPVGPNLLDKVRDIARAANVEVLI